MLTLFDRLDITEWRTFTVTNSNNAHDRSIKSETILEVLGNSVFSHE